MNIEKRANYTLITTDESSFSEFYNSFLPIEKELKNEHIIIQISEKLNSTEKDFLVFLSIAENKRENGTSFAIINTEIDIDNIPETITIVPTLIEAEDILEMEAIERELGF